MDPLADNFSGWSPYNYTLNNPLANIDPDGAYTTRVYNGVTVYRQWTLSGALQQLQKESWPTFGAFFYLKRAAINDFAFRQNSSENLQLALENFATAISKGLGINQGLQTGLTGAGIAMNNISNSQFQDLLADEVAFDEMLNTVHDGVKLAVTVEIDEDGNPISSNYGDRRMIMLNPYLRKKWLKEGKNMEEIDKAFNQQFREYRSNFFLKQNYLERYDSYDPSVN